MKAPRRVLVNVPVPNIMFCCKQAYKLPKNVLKESKSPPSGGGGGAGTPYKRRMGMCD